MDLYFKLCSYQNLELAFKKARKGKTLKNYVKEFESDLKNNLSNLRTELLFHVYKPKKLKTFILRDPKTRKISKSNFRDRVVHHALVNILQPLFEKSFIFDSYANRKGKGVLSAIKRYEFFQRKVTKNNKKPAFVLKADIKHYFNTVNHKILISIISKRVSDPKIIRLIKIIISNFSNKVGMPLGNLTSQFFTNIYLNELDQFIKHKLRVKFYIRYVDDFVLFNQDKELLEQYKLKINHFLNEFLNLKLHSGKSKVINIYQGIGFLGFRIFPYCKLLKRKNLNKFKRKFSRYCSEVKSDKLNYDMIYDFVEGWIAYAKNANTYKFQTSILNLISGLFPGDLSTKELNRLLNH